jgi:hypothetical protein
MDIATREATASRVPTVLGIAAILVWAHYLPSLWPLPPRSDLPVELQWSLWWESLLLTALGLSAAVLAMRALRFWQVALLVTSGFMVASSIPTIVADLLQAPSFEAWFGMFRGVRGASIYYLFALPLYHLAIVAAVLTHVALTFGARVYRQRNAA